MAQREVSGQERFKHAGIVGHCACFPYRSLYGANQKLNKKKKKTETQGPLSQVHLCFLGFHIN